MTEAELLNGVLARELPAAARVLSPLGRAAAFPKGIPYQAGQARGAAINATIGQLTDGAGGPLPLPEIASLVPDLDPRGVFLYLPVAGPTALRESWGARERRLAGDPDTPTSLPIAVHGLTHGLSVTAALFADPETDVVLPSPRWENYDLIFRMHAGARLVTYPFFREGRFNVEGLADRLATVRGKAVVVLNFPGNPTGYLPRAEEVSGIVDALVSHPGPLVVVCDDAYQGFSYEPGLAKRSIFWDLAERADPERLLVLKVDGATKELLFFGSRVAFITHTGTGEAEAALASKIKYTIRGAVGSISGPAATMVQRALATGSLDASFERTRQELDARYRLLREGLSELQDPLFLYPFNAAFFAMIGLPPDMDPNAARLALLHDQSLGTIALPEANALRVAYCSLSLAQIPELVSRLLKGLS